jgi:hypothetical protein
MIGLNFPHYGWLGPSGYMTATQQSLAPNLQWKNVAGIPVTFRIRRIEAARPFQPGEATIDPGLILSNALRRLS